MSVSRSSFGWAAMAFVVAASWATTARAEALAGKAVRRDVADASGNRFAVTVRPPADRPVDLRVFDVIEVSADGGDSVSAASAEAGGDLVDVSGYVVEVEPLSALATCTQKITVKNKPVSLGGNKSFTVTSSSPPLFVAVTAFPKSGNVDTYVLDGSTPCNSSKKPAGQLDNATCVAASCTGTANLIGQIKNPASAGATYAGAVNMVFQAP
jgi:hypothetical protein